MAGPIRINKGSCALQYVYSSCKFDIEESMLSVVFKDLRQIVCFYCSSPLHVLKSAGDKFFTGEDTLSRRVHAKEAGM